MLCIRPRICDSTTAEMNLKHLHKTKFAGSFVWVWNLICHIEGGAWAEGVQE